MGRPVAPRDKTRNWPAYGEPVLRHSPSDDGERAEAAWFPGDLKAKARPHLLPFDDACEAFPALGQGVRLAMCATNALLGSLGVKIYASGQRR